MTRRLSLGSAIVVGTVLLLSVAVLAARPDLRDHVTYRLTGDNIGPPAETSERSPIALAEEEPIRIAAAGDVGTGGDAEHRTAAVIDDLETESEYEALLLLGDNVYPDGDPAELDRAVFEPFAGVLDGGTQLLAVLGNHDVRDGNGDAHAAAIGMPDRWYATRIGDVLVVGLDSTQPGNPDQLAWLDATLAASDATWTVATMHHPPYSGGFHGSSLDVRDSFTPLFDRNGVQLALAGHDHDYQRSEPIDGVTYIVSGAAAKLRPANYAEFTEVAWSTHHFVDIVVWPDRMEIRAIDHDGAVIDSTTLRP